MKTCRALTPRTTLGTGGPDPECALARAGTGPGMLLCEQEQHLTAASNFFPSKSPPCAQPPLTPAPGMQHPSPGTVQPPLHNHSPAVPATACTDTPWPWAWGLERERLPCPQLHHPRGRQRKGVLSLCPDMGKLRHGPMQRAAHRWAGTGRETKHPAPALASSAGVRIIPAFAASSAACLLPAALLPRGSRRTLGARCGPGDTLQAALASNGEKATSELGEKGEMEVTCQGTRCVVLGLMTPPALRSGSAPPSPPLCYTGL